MVMLTDLPYSMMEGNVSNTVSGCLPQLCLFCFKQCSQLNLYRPQGFHLLTQIRIDGNFSPIPRSRSRLSRMMPVDSCDANSACLAFSDPLCAHNDNSIFMPPFSNGQQMDQNPRYSKQIA